MLVMQIAVEKFRHVLGLACFAPFGTGVASEGLQYLRYYVMSLRKFKGFLRYFLFIRENRPILVQYYVCVLKCGTIDIDLKLFFT